MTKSNKRNAKTNEKSAEDAYNKDGWWDEFMEHHAGEDAPVSLDLTRSEPMTRKEYKAKYPNRRRGGFTILKGPDLI
jgi:hypothetical protein